MTEPVPPTMAFTFVHAADLHLGSPLAGLAGRDPALAARVGEASWRAFEAVVDLALAEGAAFLVVAGDVFDRDWRDWSTGLAFVRQLGRLARAGLRVVLIRGNHDAESVISRSLPLPDGAVWLGADRPETIDWPDLGVAIHGISFKTAAVTDARLDRFPPPVPGRFNLGLLHTSLDGRADVGRYAPCSEADLVARGYDYWALGHVHVREVVRAAAPAIVFPGNVQGRSIRETGAKGVTLVRVDGARVTIDHRDTDVVRWAALTLDAAPAAGRDDLPPRLAEALKGPVAAAAGRPLVLRVTVAGPFADDAGLRADPARLRAELQAAAAAVSDRVLLEKVVIATRPPADAAPPAIDDLDAVLAAVLADPAFADELSADLAAVRAALPQAAAARLDDDPAALLAGARAVVLAGLRGDR